MMSTLRSGHRRAERGQAAVEALLVLMILVLVIFSGIELSRGVALRQALDSGAGAAVRALALDPAQWAFAGTMVQQGVDQNIFGVKPAVTLKVYDASGTLRSSAWLSGSPFGTAFSLEGSAPFQADIPFLSEPLVTIRVRHWGMVERYP